MSVVIPMDWRSKGACVGQDPNLWFPDAELLGTNVRANYRAAKAICATCPVITECENHARTLPEAWGIWGGLTPKERGIRRGPTLSLPERACDTCGTTFQPRTNRVRYCPPGPDGSRCRPHNANQLSLA